MNQKHPPEILPKLENYRPLKNVRVVLVSPQSSANVGSVCRLVSNFGVGELVVVDPRCDLSIEGEAGKLARGGGEQILKKIKVSNSVEQSLSDVTISFALTMHDMEDRPADMVGFSPNLDLSSDHKIALLFGREDNGLTNEECNLCTYRWAFPLNPANPSLNLSHAVAVTLSGLKGCYNSNADKLKSDDELASHDEVSGLLDHVESLLKGVDFERGVPIKYPLQVIHRLCKRSQLRMSEIKVIRGCCRRIQNKLHHLT